MQEIKQEWVLFFYFTRENASETYGKVALEYHNSAVFECYRNWITMSLFCSFDRLTSFSSRVPLFRQSFIQIRRIQGKEVAQGVAITMEREAEASALAAAASASAQAAADPSAASAAAAAAAAATSAAANPLAQIQATIAQLAAANPALKSATPAQVRKFGVLRSGPLFDNNSRKLNRNSQIFYHLKLIYWA